MAAAPITYARVYGPPADWRGLKVYDLNTGQEVKGVVEVNTVEGWVRRYREYVPGFRDARGRFSRQPLQERLTGRFEITNAGGA